jgi:hypothetical protein
LWLYCIQWSVICCYHCTVRVCSLYKEMISLILFHLYISSEDDNNLLFIFVQLFIWQSFGIIIIIIIIMYSFINSWFCVNYISDISSIVEVFVVWITCSHSNHSHRTFQSTSRNFAGSPSKDLKS